MPDPVDIRGTIHLPPDETVRAFEARGDLVPTVRWHDMYGEEHARAFTVAKVAKACAADSYMQTAIHTIQIHGGIGFTWDNDTHLWFKRAKSSEVFLGDPTYHRELMMRAWGV